ncbi:hypothetical protein SISNIDRAFT_461193 [Sistotremastrum niveocremeum HHB9708]|uniref:Uncharacterized protein n=2 Tax=Sistotremastraceae TaxID=3402574 RepID=A0A164MW80_9AGAM|nr:hypothetical protein SISNIDRAFT_461193 [Sistotremastrum niveocremeum HHB9708]KZT32294.1 hypothetical protein SISSUDRAFT_1055719 [Sistotremastrum suecicum HHB10207 ss-3]
MRSPRKVKSFRSEQCELIELVVQDLRRTPSQRLALPTSSLGLKSSTSIIHHPSLILPSTHAVSVTIVARRSYSSLDSRPTSRISFIVPPSHSSVGATFSPVSYPSSVMTLHGYPRPSTTLSSFHVRASSVSKPPFSCWATSTLQMADTRPRTVYGGDI